MPFLSIGSLGHGFPTIQGYGNKYNNQQERIRGNEQGKDLSRHRIGAAHPGLCRPAGLLHDLQHHESLSGYSSNRYNGRVA